MPAADKPRPAPILLDWRLMRLSIRAAVPVLGIVTLAGAAGQLIVSSRLQKDFGSSQSLCQLYICDDATVVTYAYDQQLKGNRDSLSVAIQLLQNALIRDPASALRWADLGDAFADAGSIDKAGICYDRAVSLGHTSARILIGAGDFYLRYGDRIRGIRYLTRTLTLTSERNASVFSYFTARNARVEEVLANGFPAEPRTAQAYLKHLMSESTPSDTRLVWKWMVAQHLVDEKIAGEYANFLVKRSLYTEAADAWSAAAGERGEGYRASQFLYNGDFELEPVATVFDWNILPVSHVEVTRDSKAHSGRFSLHIQFDGMENTDFSHVSQNTVLRPGRYRFQAWVRSENLTTDQGVYFRIADAEDPRRLSVETEQTHGTTGWHLITSTFVVSPATSLVVVRIHRRPAWKFDNQIKGGVWIDQVSLTPLG